MFGSTWPPLLARIPSEGVCFCQWSMPGWESGLNCEHPLWAVDVNGDERFMFFIPPPSVESTPPLPNTFQTSNMNHVSAHQINFLVQAGLLSQHLISSSCLHLLFRLFLLFSFGFFSLSLLVMNVFCMFYVRWQNGEKKIELNLFETLLLPY